MDFTTCRLPYVGFKTIRDFVGERFPGLQTELHSTVFEKADRICKYMYAIPHTTDHGIDWTMDSFRRVLEQDKYQRMILGLGHIVYVRTIPILNEDTLQFERCTFQFPAFRTRWTFQQFLGYMCECESHLRERHNHNLGHLYGDGLEMERIQKVVHIFPYLQ